MSSRSLVFAVAATLVIVSILTNVMTLLRFGLTGGPKQFVELFLTCLLSYSLIQGWRPGRWIAIVLIGIGGAFSLIAGFALLSRIGGAAVLLLFLGIVYAACVVALLTPTAAEHFE